MARLLILGGTGMLGHKLWQVARDRHETWVTVRGAYRDHARLGLFDRERTLEGVDAFRFDTIARAVARARPDVVINAVGVVKQRPEAEDPVTSLTLNSLLPHRLALLCRVAGARLLHVSTDCVFSGRRGRYWEEDPADAEDLYGRTKLLGEVAEAPALTLRTSFIGRELTGRTGLLEWFLGRAGGTVQGYTQAIYSGVTSLELAKIVADLVERPGLAGIYHVAGETISKHDLLRLVREAFGVKVEIEPAPEVRVDRSLDATRFWTAVGGVPPSWPRMLAELAADSTPYGAWRAEG